jgi:hypothetical protein
VGVCSGSTGHSHCGLKPCVLASPACFILLPPARTRVSSRLLRGARKPREQRLVLTWELPCKTRALMIHTLLCQSRGSAASSAGRLPGEKTCARVSPPSPGAPSTL